MPSASTYPPASYIDPVALLQIGSLELRARAVVEGFFAGLHRSPYHGFSVEFTEYRQYVPGDDPRRLDWRLYARSDRYFVKQYEDETNLRCHLLVDNSRSMAFGTLPHTKAEYAKTLAATLGYFLHIQRDAVGLVLVDEQIDAFIPARHRAGQFRRIVHALDRPPVGRATHIAEALEQVAQRVHKRGMLVLISDFLTPLEALATRFTYLQARGHDVIAFQVLDPAELSFDFDEPTLFTDMESGREVFVDPAQAKALYLERIGRHLRELEKIAVERGVALYRVTTDTPLERPLSEFLYSRQRAGGRGRRRRGVGVPALAGAAAP
jgi:uncharacterized protein (DUF58 family)